MVSFATEFDAERVRALVLRAESASPAAAQASLDKPALDLADFARLISPAAA